MIIVAFNIVTVVDYVMNHVASRRSNKMKFKGFDECRNVRLAAVRMSRNYETSFA